MTPSASRLPCLVARCIPHRDRTELAKQGLEALVDVTG
jgi:hypothetical protein